jgi:hypothetical protein
MAKRITLSLFVLLIVSAFVFVSCGQEPVPAPEPKPELQAVENKAGEVSGNKVYNGDFDSAEDTDLITDGASAEITEGVGIDGSSGLVVNSAEKYGQVYIDFTKEYGRGKSYYVEASFKDNGSTNPANLKTASISFTVVSGAVMDAVASQPSWDDYYSCQDIYDGSWLSDDEADEIFGIETNCIGEDLSDGEWHTVSAILDAETIDKLLADTTAKYGSGTPTINYLFFGFFVGDYQNGGQNDYKFILDNVVIKDLNTEIKKEGKTYVVDEPEEPEEEEEEEEEV